MLLSGFIRDAVKKLRHLYPEDEARSMVMYYCSEVFGLPSYIHVTEPATEVPSDLLERALADLRRLEAAEPLQYVLGYTEFCGRRFKCDGRALIPRAETELLCMKAIEMAPPAPVVLDLCTGSGCIAWTLALELPGAVVTASDISADALDLARSQFSAVRKPALKPRFVQADVLDVEASVSLVGEGQCRLLTANPPYVTLPEKAEMRPNVLDWEPEMAIFAPERDTLAFHRAIALIARRVLAPGGRGIVEINSELPEESAAVFRAAGLVGVECVPDYFERPRYVVFSQIPG